MSEIFGSFLWIVNRNHRVECAEKGANKNGWREKERVLMALRSEHPPETKQQQKKISNEFENNGSPSNNKVKSQEITTINTIIGINKFAFSVRGVHSTLHCPCPCPCVCVAAYVCRV